VGVVDNDNIFERGRFHVWLILAYFCKPRYNGHMPGFEQQPSQAPERHAPPPQEIGQTVEVREVAEAPSKTELRKLVKKYEAKVVDTYAEEKLYGIPNAPYTRAPEGEELTVKRFEKRED